MEHAPPRKLMKRFDNGTVRFSTFSCYRRMQLFRNDAIKDAFVEMLAAGQQKFGFELRAWVVMPEHVHLLLRPVPDDAKLAPVLAWIKGGFAKRVIGRWRELGAPILARIKGGDGAPWFWQRGGGHDRNIRTLEEYVEKLGYIHRNPCKRGLVKDPCDWPWSSARAYAGIKHPLLKVWLGR